MKMKSTLILSSLIGMHTICFADVNCVVEETCQVECCAPEQQALVEVKAGYFFFTDHKMREIFNHGGFDGQLSVSIPLFWMIHLYAAGEYLEKSGHSRGGHQSTRIWEIPVSLGLRGVWRFCNDFSAYLTLGPRYFLVHVHNLSHFVPKSLHQHGCGGFANAGLLYTLCDHFTFDVFGEYSYKRLHFHSHKPNTQGHTVQVGGLTFGGGIGYSF